MRKKNKATPTKMINGVKHYRIRIDDSEGRGFKESWHTYEEYRRLSRLARELNSETRRQKRDAARIIVSHKEDGAIITKPVDEAIDDYFKKIGVNKPYGFYGYMDETEIKVYKNKDIEQAIYLERKRRKTNPGPEYY